jgi:predicted RNA-binding protein YlqC (UPF0109 family)
MKELVQYLAKALATSPGSVVVTESVAHDTSILQLKVAKEDLGRIIGKQGRTAKSIRALVNAAAAAANRKIVLEILDEK